MNRETMLTKLKDLDVRMTKVWQSIFEYFETNELATFTAKELLDYLQKNNPTLNKSSLYRKLEKLEAVGIINKFEIGENEAFYELSEEGCHHHIICEKCSNIIHVEIPPSRMQKLQKELSKSTGAVIKRHKLEFFGECGRC